MKKHPQYDRKSMNTPSPAGVKKTGTSPLNVKSNPVYKGDNSPKTNPTAFGGKQ